MGVGLCDLGAGRPEGLVGPWALPADGPSAARGPPALPAVWPGPGLPEPGSPLAFPRAGLSPPWVGGGRPASWDKAVWVMRCVGWFRAVIAAGGLGSPVPMGQAPVGWLVAGDVLTQDVG